MAAVDVVIMAAGKGTRMKSARPKVLHRLAGQSLLQHVLYTAAELKANRRIVITDHYYWNRQIAQLVTEEGDVLGMRLLSGSAFLSQPLGFGLSLSRGFGRAACL